MAPWNWRFRTWKPSFWGSMFNLGMGNSLKILLQTFISRGRNNLSQFCRFGLRISRLCALPAALPGATTMLGLHDFLPLSSVSARDLEVEKIIHPKKKSCRNWRIFSGEKILELKKRRIRKNHVSIGSFQIPSLKLTLHLKVDGWKTSFLLEWIPGRCELLVWGRLVVWCSPRKLGKKS